MNEIAVVHEAAKCVALLIVIYFFCKWIFED